MRSLERVGSYSQKRVSAGSKPGDERGVGVGESRQPATHPLDQLVWAVWTVRAEPAKLIRLFLLRPTLLLPSRGIKRMPGRRENLEFERSS